jgi:protein-glutamine gamma-glutamyltransferase
VEARFMTRIFLHLGAPPIYALVAAVFMVPLADLRVALAAGASALLGAGVAFLLARSALRTAVLALLTLASVLGAIALGSWLAGSSAVATALGAEAALFWSGIAGTCLGSFALACGLRALVLRQRFFSLFEVLAIGGALSQLVVAHRFGAINRPFELADSILAQGGDPTAALLLIGGVAALLIVMLLLQERSVWRGLLHLSLAFLMLALILSSTSMLGLPSPPTGATGLGLRPDDKPTDSQETSGDPKPNQGKSDNERLEFRDNYNSEGRQVPLAVVLLHDDYSPPSGLYYFRQTAFSQFNGQRLVSATRSDVDRDIVPSFVVRPTDLLPVPNASGDRVELDTTVALLAEHTRAFALESAQRMEPLQNPDSSRFRRTYRATSLAMQTKQAGLMGRNVGDPQWNEAVRAHYTQAPTDPRYAELAQRIVDEMNPMMREDPVARAIAVSLWLSREGTYSLKSDHAGADDPTAHFLFGDLVGYCVHFSHAAVYLMRALGIPARVGAGYVVDEAARHGGSSILITGANAHAWPELYVDGVGWVVNDVSPEHALDAPPPPPDPDLQRMLGDMARGLKPMPQSEERPLQPILHAAARLRDAALRTLGAGLLIALVLLYMGKLWRRLAPSFASRALPRVAYRAELDRLAEVALHRQHGETREAFAARVARLTPSFVRLTDRHLAAVFGVPRENDLQELRVLRAAVARELSGGVSWWRRWLGVLTPWSWLRSR